MSTNLKILSDLKIAKMNLAKKLSVQFFIFQTETFILETSEKVPEPLKAAGRFSEKMVVSIMETSTMEKKHGYGKINWPDGCSYQG